MDSALFKTSESSVYPHRTDMTGPTLNNFNVYSPYGGGTMDHWAMDESWLGTTLNGFNTLQNPRIQCLPPKNAHAWTDFEHFQCLSTIWGGYHGSWSYVWFMNWDHSSWIQDTSKPPNRVFTPIERAWLDRVWTISMSIHPSDEKDEWVSGSYSHVWIMSWDHSRWIQHPSKPPNRVFTLIEPTWLDRLWTISMSIHSMDYEDEWVPWIIESMNHDLGPL